MRFTGKHRISIVAAAAVAAIVGTLQLPSTAFGTEDTPSAASATESAGIADGPPPMTPGRTPP
ncbi:hypothetical protein [Streptomyces yangpuensis]|uniref:hypothetical protein n=1 Tax=Streptomyces yangpuensis TaxID=1648182 RepID=UPI000629C728|nr:hypothetical protein [Streptomyces yangpuensis]